MVPGKALRQSRTRIFEEEKANHCGWRGQGEGKWCEMQRREASVGSGRAPWDMFRVLDLFQKQAESQEAHGMFGFAFHEDEAGQSVKKRLEGGRPVGRLWGEGLASVLVEVVGEGGVDLASAT